MTAAAGLEPGAVVIAGEQTAGQGRHGHAWHSEPGNGMYVSMVLRAHSRADAGAGAGGGRSDGAATGVACDLRWPNDLMIGVQKVAGILVQLVDGRAIAGIGINVNHREFSRRTRR